MRVSKQVFFNHFKEDRYRRPRKGDPDPPIQMMHLDWIFDEVTKTYVGSIETSSWNPDVIYEIIGLEESNHSIENIDCINVVKTLMIEKKML